MQKENDTLNSFQRLSELIIIIGMIVLFSFFMYHQWLDTGFFTEEFGTLEKAALYVPIILALFAPAIRAITGRRNLARLFEIITNLSLAAGSLYLLIVFPFNYAHLADVLPEALRFMLSWVTDGMAKAIFLLQVIVGPISSLGIIWQYWRNSHKEASFERVGDTA